MRQWQHQSPLLHRALSMNYVAPCGCLAANFDSCNSLLSSVHTVLVNSLRCVRLYIKRKYKKGRPNKRGMNEMLVGVGMGLEDLREVMRNRSDWKMLTMPVAKMHLMYGTR